MADDNPSNDISPSETPPEPATVATDQPQQQQQQPGLSREQMQIVKLREANSKYKSLLKMAKERIQTQEDELEKLKEELSQLRSSSSSPPTTTNPTPPPPSSSILPTTEPENDTPIHRVLHRVKLDSSSPETDETIEIHALVEYQSDFDENTETYTSAFQKWEKFSSEAELSDFVRRDTGEPISLPPYSLTPEQSELVEEEARQAVAHVTEEFRRYRVRAEVARKQADAAVRALHSTNVMSTKKRIEGEDLENELALARTEHAQLDNLKRELATQEAHWKKAYDTLRAENNALKSSGAEALLAAQWRQRYESCLRDKEDLESKLELLQTKVNKLTDEAGKADIGKYEMKYRELKEAFRSYRKKAKEIFDDLQRGNPGLINLSDKVAEDAKIQYLRNLMVNYLTSDPAMKEHMELAIGTVLKFSDEEKAKIEKSRKEMTDAWFSSLMPQLT